MKKTILISILGLSLFQCRTDDGNERLETASQKVGTSTANIVKGVKAGIEKVSKINISVSESLKAKGLSTGKVELSSKGGRHNLLNVYMVFDKNINKPVVMKVYNSQNQEIGRCKTTLNGTEGDAKYVDFLFDKHTNIDRDNKITLD